MNQPAEVELFAVAEQALSDSETYLVHIANLMGTAAEHLRAGRDRDGLSTFARGASDLSEFMKLFEHLIATAQPRQADATDAFRCQLHEVVGELDEVLRAQDLVSLSDRIEARLLPIVPDWPAVTAELGQGLAARAR